MSFNSFGRHKYVGMGQSAVGASKIRNRGIRWVEGPHRQALSRSRDQIVRNTFHDTDPMHGGFAVRPISIGQREDKPVLAVFVIAANLRDPRFAEKIRGFGKEGALLCHAAGCLEAEQLDINRFALPLLASPGGNSDLHLG